MVGVWPPDGHLRTERGARRAPTRRAIVPRRGLAAPDGTPVDGDRYRLRRGSLGPDGRRARAPWAGHWRGVRWIGLRLGGAGAGVRGDGAGAALLAVPVVSGSGRARLA